MKQIYPATITGKSFAPGGSVLDHAFGQSEAYTLGVEEEYMLLDGESFDLVQHIDTVLAAISGHELETHINAELMQSVLEIATPVCRTAGDIDHELRRLRAYVAGIASEDNLRVGSAGTHPFSLFERQRITARDRYRHLIDQMQYVARRELIFGLHIHVADAVALAAYCQDLVKHYCERSDRGEEIPSYHRILTTENKWLAARYGLEAPVMDLATGRRNRVPVAQIVRRTLRDIEPHARELG